MQGDELLVEQALVGLAVVEPNGHQAKLGDLPQFGSTAQ